MLDTDSVEECGETTAARRFQAQEGESSADSDSDRCEKPEKKKRTKKAGAKPAAKKAWTNDSQILQTTKMRCARQRRRKPKMRS